MHLHSTRDRSVVASFEEAIFQGLAPDGGLYVITQTPELTDLIRSFDENSTFLEIAISTIDRLLGDEFKNRDETVDTLRNPIKSGSVAEDICRRAFTFEPILSPLENDIDLLELFHGPSCAFKDFGASFLSAAMEHFLETVGRRAIILTATSGDTGSAVAQAFKGRDGVDVVILYPKGRVTPLQELQLTTVGGNVHALEVRGSFDECQRMVKEAFLDKDLALSLSLTSANSINIGRLLPQALYYVFAASRFEEPAVFCVPSGNFGNLTAGVMAMKWGMPVGGFVAATNVNDVVPEYLKTGLFTARPSVHTYSNAMDVGNPSNFERLLDIFQGDRNLMASSIRGEVVNDDETIAEIRRVRKDHDVMICPHTAVGTIAARRQRDSGSNRGHRIVSLATAHPAKFGEMIRDALGTGPPLPRQLERVLAKEKESTEIEAELSALRNVLMAWFG